MLYINSAVNFPKCEYLEMVSSELLMQSAKLKMKHETKAAYFYPKRNPQCFELEQCSYHICFDIYKFLNVEFLNTSFPQRRDRRLGISRLSAG